MLPLVGDFQAMNVLAALGLAIATGAPVDARARRRCRASTGVPGRMQRVGDASERRAGLRRLRPHARRARDRARPRCAPHCRGRLVVVFGCGGDRDRGKRPLMGAIAARLADLVIVTDDNPRSEEPAAIRRAILAAAPGGRRDRRPRAPRSRRDRARSQPGDLLVIAGKGHETGQIVGDMTLPFDDAEVARAVAGRAGHAPHDRALDRRRGRRRHRRTQRRATGSDRRLDRQPHRRAGRSVRRAGRPEIRRPRFRRRGARARRRRGAWSSRVPPASPPTRRCSSSPTPWPALEALGRAARQRSHAPRSSRVTGSVGKTGTKEALRRALRAPGPTFASAGSLNNQWGVPLSLARMPRETALRRVRDRHEPSRRDRRADAAWCGPQSRVITTIEPAHLGFFPSVEAIADAKAEIFDGMEPRRRRRAQPRQSALRAPRRRGAARGITRILGFGAHAEAAVRLIDCHLYATASAVTASVHGRDRRLLHRHARPALGDEQPRRARRGQGAPAAMSARPPRRSPRSTPLDGRGRRHASPSAAAAPS